MRSLEMARFTRRYPVVLETLMKQMLAMVHVSGLQCRVECMVECMNDRMDECMDITACIGADTVRILLHVVCGTLKAPVAHCWQLADK